MLFVKNSRKLMEKTLKNKIFVQQFSLKSLFFFNLHVIQLHVIA